MTPDCTPRLQSPLSLGGWVFLPMLELELPGNRQRLTAFEHLPLTGHRKSHPDLSNKSTPGIYRHLEILSTIPREAWAQGGASCVLRIKQFNSTGVCGTLLCPQPGYRIHTFRE